LRLTIEDRDRLDERQLPALGMSASSMSSHIRSVSTDRPRRQDPAALDLGAVVEHDADGAPFHS
jgi:hypothetical protein